MYDWHFGEYEYLGIIISLMRPEKIYKNETAYDEMLTNYDDKRITEIYSIIKKTPEVNKIYQAALHAIKNGHIKAKSKKKNGEVTPLTKVEPITFFEWAEKKGYEIRYTIKESLKTYILDQRIRDYKSYLLNKNDFTKLRREPLWKLPTGILYIMGFSSLGTPDKDDKCVKKIDELNKIYQYAIDSQKIDKLKLIRDNYPNSVQPEKLIEWAISMDIKSPMVEVKTDPSKKINKEKATYETPDMKLMQDAITKFWSGYNLSNPDPSRAPFKKTVVDWLVQEAANRNIEGFSKSRAQTMDTIIRCPKARQGGNTR